MTTRLNRKETGNYYEIIKKYRRETEKVINSVDKILKQPEHGINVNKIKVQAVKNHKKLVEEWDKSVKKDHNKIGKKIKLPGIIQTKNENSVDVNLAESDRSMLPIINEKISYQTDNSSIDNKPNVYVPETLSKKRLKMKVRKNNSENTMLRMNTKNEILVKTDSSFMPFFPESEVNPDESENKKKKPFTTRRCSHCSVCCAKQNQQSTESKKPTKNPPQKAQNIKKENILPNLKKNINSVQKMSKDNTLSPLIKKNNTSIPVYYNNYEIPSPPPPTPEDLMYASKELLGNKTELYQPKHEVTPKHENNSKYSYTDTFFNVTKISF